MKNFLFPIETTARELDHKILMAVLACEPDRSIYVGDQQLIRTLSFYVKGGVYYGKHLFGKPMFSDTNYYNRIKKNGFNLVHLNEEGAVWAGRENEWKGILKQCERPSVLEKDDHMTLWGEWQKRFNSSYEPIKVNLEVTGHPKFDLYQQKYRDYFSEDVENIKSQHGDFILINTAFSLSNNGKGGDKFIFKSKLSYDVNNTEHRKYLFRDWKNQMVAQANMVYLINKLNLEFPDKTIIIRPHPSEETSYYKNLFQNISNVKVIYQGSVTPWILACDVLIHNGCTTSIEASLAQKPVINFTVDHDPDFEVYLASICGVRLTTSDDVIREIKELYKTNQWKHDFIPNDQLGDDLFKNFKDKSTAYNVLKTLDIASTRDVEQYRGLGKFGVKSFCMLHRVYLLLKFTYMICKKNNASNKDYLKRFERFDKKDIIKKVEKMCLITGRKVKVKYCDSFLFLIEHEDDFSGEN